MSGIFGVASREDCIFDLFYGVDYHSHLGTRRAGLAVYDEKNGFDKSIHNIENAPFRTKFSSEINDMHGNYGIGCISDFEPQPIHIRSHHGTFAITTVGKINNIDKLVNDILNGQAHFFEMQNSSINQTELIAAIINQKENFIDGIQYALDVVDGSISILILTEKGIYAARDKFGRTPLAIGKKEGSICASFESFAYLNLGYSDYKILGPGEIVVFDSENIRTLVTPGKDMKICTFLWVYYGYPSASYEGLSVEEMRYNCGRCLAKRDKDDVRPDLVAGVPDSGLAHAIGYANESGVPFSRPFVKYTPTWPRSFLPTHQSKRDLIAKMKLIPIHDLISNKNLLLIDDSIVRGTQLRETVEFLYDSGAKTVHMRSACPPIMYPCKYLNFSRAISDMELIARRTIMELEGEEGFQHIEDYSDGTTERGKNMRRAICEKLHLASLEFQSLEGVVRAIGLEPCKLCTYCWNGKE